jgi:hypothetical protein
MYHLPAFIRIYSYHDYRYPSNIPAAALLDNLHRDKTVTKKRLRVFYYGFVALFLYQAFPQYISKLNDRQVVFMRSSLNDSYSTYPQWCLNFLHCNAK